MRRVPEAKASWFSRKESSKLPVLVFSFGKVNPRPSPGRYDPSSAGTAGMKRSRWTVWGILSLQERLDSTIQRWAFFSWASRAIFSIAGPVIRNLPLVVAVYVSVCVCARWNVSISISVCMRLTDYMSIQGCFLNLCCRSGLGAALQLLMDNMLFPHTSRLIWAWLLTKCLSRSALIKLTHRAWAEYQMLSQDHADKACVI